MSGVVSTHFYCYAAVYCCKLFAQSAFSVAAVFVSLFPLNNERQLSTLSILSKPCECLLENPGLC